MPLQQKSILILFLVLKMERIREQRLTGLAKDLGKLGILSLHNLSLWHPLLFISILMASK